MENKIDLTLLASALLSDEGDDNDLSYLKANNARALPPSPSANKWDYSAILKQLYKPSEILFGWHKKLGDAVYSILTNVNTLLSSGVVNGAKYDAEGNQIDEAYALKSYVDGKDSAAVHLAGSETITGAKTFGANVAFGSSGSDNSKTFDVYFATNLRGPVTSSPILPGNTGFSIGASNSRWNTVFSKYFDAGDGIKKGGTSYVLTLPDSSGTIAVESYVNSEVGKIVNGDYIAKKAERDEDGNKIKTTYETKSDAQTKASRSNLVSTIGEATQLLSGLLSSTDKSRLDALYALLGAEADQDAVVNTINEVLAIFAQYPEGVTIANALALKVAFSDVINNLESNEISKPLSAYQGKVLDERLAEVEENYVDRDDVFAAGMIHVGEYNQDTGEIEITYNSNVTSISYDDDTGILTIAY